MKEGKKEEREEGRGVRCGDGMERGGNIRRERERETPLLECPFFSWWTVWAWAVCVCVCVCVCV